MLKYARSEGLRVASAAMAAVVLASAVGCSSPPSSTSVAAVAVKQLDGKSLFKGIYFGQGAAASLFPEIWDRKEFASAKAAAATRAPQIDELTVAIAARHPGFFDRFATEIESGDHLRVAKIIQEGGANVMSTVSGTDLGGTQGECLELLVVATALAISVYVVVVLAAAYFVATAAQETLYQTDAITSNTAITDQTTITTSPPPVCASSCATACASTCGGSVAYHGGDALKVAARDGGVAGSAAAADAGPTAKADAGATPASTLLFEEYTDLIAMRLGPAM